MMGCWDDGMMGRRSAGGTPRRSFPHRDDQAREHPHRLVDQHADTLNGVGRGEPQRFGDVQLEAKLACRAHGYMKECHEFLVGVATAPFSDVRAH
jgi:hypothetical protein